MLRALFSARFFQQLLREGKLTNERIYFYTILLHLVAFPCLLLTVFQFYIPQFSVAYLHKSALNYGIIFVAIVVLLGISRFTLWYFSAIFNYQEQRYLYTFTKTLYRFYNGLLLIAIIPITWYARVPNIILFIYIPLFVVIFCAFFIRFLKNIFGVSRIHFFIYFCSLEILPYLLLVKTLDIIYN